MAIWCRTLGCCGVKADDAYFFSDRSQRFLYQCTECIGSQKWFEHRQDVRLVGTLQHEVRCVPGTIAADQYSGLLFRQTTLAGFAAPLAGTRLKPCLLPFCDSRKWVSSTSATPARLISLLTIRQTQEEMAPAECCVGMDANRSSAFADARPFSHLLRVVDLFCFVAKSRQGCVDQGIKGRSASVTTIPLQAVGKPTPRN